MLNEKFAATSASFSRFRRTQKPSFSPVNAVMPDLEQEPYKHQSKCMCIFKQCAFNGEIDTSYIYLVLTTSKGPAFENPTGISQPRVSNQAMWMWMLISRTGLEVCQPTAAAGGGWVAERGGGRPSPPSRGRPPTPRRCWPCHLSWVRAAARPAVQTLPPRCGTDMASAYTQTLLQHGTSSSNTDPPHIRALSAISRDIDADTNSNPVPHFALHTRRH